ncbi:MAG: hypothetical protein JST00_10450 [Deltaproteobacteria bacterium]|nr:hypothetical protein [Deltaproteobacteria bacterium]
MNRSAPRAAVVVAVVAMSFSLGACKKRKRPDDIPIAELQARAAKFEPVMAAIKRLPVSPPPVTRTYGPADAYIGTPAVLGTKPEPNPYLVIHAEDLATPPSYWSDDKVKVRITGTGVLSACAKGLDEVKTTKEDAMSQYTLLPCTGFKYAFVIRTTAYTPPATKTVGDQTKDKTRTITSAVIPGRVSADVTIYSLPDGKEVGAFQYTATSSDKPSLEGGFQGAVDRDLLMQADLAIRAASSNKVAAAPAATTPPKKK